MRTHDYELLKATVDEMVAAGTTALTSTTWRQASAVYADLTHLRREQVALFDTCPLVVAFTGELPTPTSFVSRQVAGTPVLVVRQSNGSVKAFLNSCRHRGTEVVWSETTGCARRFTCPYHGWTYGTDGRLLGITTTVGFPDVDRATHGLVELGCAERHGLVWVARRPGVDVDLDTFLGPLDAEFAAMELGEFVVERTVELSPKANWKLIMDGFMETYHVRFLHAKTLTSYIYSDVAPFHPLGRHGRHVAPRLCYDAASHSNPAAFLAQVLIEFQLFPNTNVLWASDHFEIFQVEPDPERADRARVRMTLLVHAAQRDRTAHWDRNVEITTNIIVSEDFACAESVQRALNGGAAPTEVVYGRNEAPLQHYHQQLATALAETAEGAKPRASVSVLPGS